MSNPRVSKFSNSITNSLKSCKYIFSNPFKFSFSKTNKASVGLKALLSSLSRSIPKLSINSNMSPSLSLGVMLAILLACSQILQNFLSNPNSSRYSAPLRK